MTRNKQFHHWSMMRQSFTGLLLVVLATTIGCSASDTLLPPSSVDPETAYWSLELNQRALLLAPVAPYDTVRLIATPRTVTGQVWEPSTDGTVNDGPTIFTSSDPAIEVSSDGLVRATKPGLSARITVSRTIHGVTHTDEATIQTVFSPAPPFQMLTTFYAKGDPDPFAYGSLNDSTKRAMDLLYIPWSPVALDADGIPMFLNFDVTSSDSTVLQALGTTIIPKKPGTSLLTISIWALGVIKRDTFTFTVGYPIHGEFSVQRKILPDRSVQPLFVGTQREVGPGGTVTWVNMSGLPMDVIFDDPSAALDAIPDFSVYPEIESTGPGNIVTIPSDTSSLGASTVNRRSRRFLHPGQYRFTVLPFGLVGTVVVKPI